MLSKCANPSCSTALIYLREGKIFMMEHGGQPQIRPEGPVLVKPGNRVEHFWLCGPCSGAMTMIYDRNHGIIVIPKSRARSEAAS